mmetsp:Transcript_8747/g.14235  ORF Transcript_8747/g.14235 Transcript_8747/m.14235 type:complete len:548 (-) Transcript_8747:103-1746(-)
MDAAYEWACAQVGIAVHPRLLQNCAEYSENVGMWRDSHSFPEILSLGGALPSFTGRDRPIQDADVAAVCLLLQSWAKSVAQLPTVHLDLTGEAITCEGARTIAAVLQVDCGLRAVSLRQTEVSDRGVAALGSVLGGSKLAELDLGQCAIHNSGIRYFVRGLQKLGPPVMFTTLLLDGNPLGDAAIVDLISLLEGVHRPPALTSLSVRPQLPGSLSVEVDAALRVLCDLCRIDLREPLGRSSHANWEPAATYTPSNASNSLLCSTDMVPIPASPRHNHVATRAPRSNQQEARSSQNHLAKHSNAATNNSSQQIIQASSQLQTQLPPPLPTALPIQKGQGQPPPLPARTPPVSRTSHAPQQQQPPLVQEAMHQPVVLQTPHASPSQPSALESSHGLPHGLVTPSSRNSRHLAEWMAGTERELRELKWLFGASVARVDGQHALLMQEMDKLRNQIDVWAGEGKGDGIGGFALGGNGADEARLETLEARFDALEKLVGREQTECSQMWHLVETAIGANAATTSESSRLHSGTAVAASAPPVSQTFASNTPQ